MILQISQIDRTAEINIEPVTQLCGQNIVWKNQILRIIKKYFSGEKYADYEEKNRGIIRLDGEEIGRKYFRLIKCADRASMIETIKIGKTNLLTQCIRYFLNDFDCQQQMSYIDENLTKIYLMLNKMLERNIVNLQLDYQYSDLWDIVQKSEVYLSDSRHIEEASDFELVNLCIDIIKQLLEINPEKTMILWENIDHLLTTEEYEYVVKACEDITKKYDIYFIFTTSLQQYVYVTESTIEDIHVYNAENFIFPEIEKVQNFVNNHYPYYKEWSKEELYKVIKNNVHKIGMKGYLEEDKNIVVLKLINDTFFEKEVKKEQAHLEESSFLLHGNML